MWTLNIYKYAHDYAIERDIIIADTKLEFGFIDGKLSTAASTFVLTESLPKEQP